MKTSENMHILYAEDNEDTCLMITVLLGFSGIAVTCAATIAETWKLAQTEKFDLYLLDSQFPDGSGLNLCRRLREYAPHTPILIYSGNAYEIDKKNGLAAGADIYLTKPYFGDVTKTILQAIKTSKSADIFPQSKLCFGKLHVV